MKLVRNVALVVILCVLALLAWLLHFVWPLDFFRGSQLVANEFLGNGYELQVRQQWGIDFYHIELIIRLPDGNWGWACIDGDDMRWWFARIAVDYHNKRALIYNWRTLRGVYKFDDNAFYRVNRHNSNDWMRIEVMWNNTNFPPASI